MVSLQKNDGNDSLPFTIRLASLNDAFTLTDIGSKTFNETFASYNTKENMQLYVDQTFTIDAIKKEILDEASTFILAQDEDKVVGYAKLKTGNNPDDLAEINTIEIERIYCIKEYYGKKVGSMLMQTCIETASQRGYGSIWLGVWEHNPRAIAFYKKWGFEIFGAHPFMLGTDLQIDLLMKKKIKLTMRIHRYNTTTTWTGNLGQGTSEYKAYDRAHTIGVTGKPDIQGTSDAAFRGDKTKHTPEDLFVSSLSTCHMLWYLHLCAVNGIVVTEYIDQATGTMEEDINGSGHFTNVTLNPRVSVREESMIEKANALHDDAHQMCFIARSVNFPVVHKPTAVISELALKH